MSVGNYCCTKTICLRILLLIWQENFIQMFSFCKAKPSDSLSLCGWTPEMCVRVCMHVFVQEKEHRVVITLMVSGYLWFCRGMMSNDKHTLLHPQTSHNAPQRLQRQLEDILTQTLLHISGLSGTSCLHSNDLHSRAGGLCVRGPSAERLHGSSRWLPPHSSSSSFLLLSLPWGAGERAEGQSRSGLSPGSLHGPLRPAGGLPLLPAQPPAPAAALAQGPLHGGREAEGPTPGSCGEVSCEEEVSSTAHHLGRRDDQLLFQGRGLILV